MENPFIDILGHPGDPRYPIDVKKIVQTSKETKCLLEINNASLVPSGFRKGSDIIIEQILNYAMKYEVPVVLGSDAHFYMQIGDFTYCNSLLEKVGFPDELVVNTSTKKLKKALKRNQ
jgi:putative hydrolase